MEEAIADLLGNDEEAVLKTLQVLDPANYLSQFLKVNTRPSARPLHTARPTTILQSTLTRNASGSALVRIGETRVLAGTTLMVGKPSASSPKCGDISIKIDMGPLCSPKYNSSNRIQPLEYKWNANYQQQSLDKQRSIESWIMRTLIYPSRNNHNSNINSSFTNTKSNGSVIDLEQLGIEEHKSAWRIVVSVLILNYDGNVEDAAFLAVVAALKDTVLPPTKTVANEIGMEVVALNTSNLDGLNNNQNESNNERVGKRLQLNCIPIPLTFGFFLVHEKDGDNGNIMEPTHIKSMNRRNEYKMIVDPDEMEENVIDGFMSIVVGVDANREQDDLNKEILVLSVNKPGGKVIVKAQDIAACMQLCKGRALELAPILSKMTENT